MHEAGTGTVPDRWPGRLVRDEGKRFRVSSEAYTSDEIFELELARIFARSWIFVGHEAMIPEEGDYVTTTIGRLPVIVSRSSDGTCHVLLNRCAHRGSVVCREERGRASTFRCPYHGWVYSNDGRLVGAAQRNGYPDDFADWGLRLHAVPHVDTYRGLIFANLDPEAEPLADRLASVKRYVDCWADRSPTGQIDLPQGAHRYEYPGNWKFQCENGVDGYHGNYVHESFAQLLDRSGERNANEFTAGRNSIDGVNAAKGLPRGDAIIERADGMIGTMDFRRYPEYRAQLASAHGEQRAADALLQRNIFIYPNLFLFESHIRVVRPVKSNLTYVDVLPTVLVGVPDELNMARRREHERFFGPAGFGAPDDIEIFVCTQTGVAAQEDPWMELSRGLHREVENEAGELVGHSSDETTQRSQYREWARLMSIEGDLA